MFAAVVAGAPANEAKWEYTADEWTDGNPPSHVTVTDVEDLPAEQRRYAKRLVAGERIETTVYHFHILSHELSMSRVDGTHRLGPLQSGLTALNQEWVAHDGQVYSISGGGYNDARVNPTLFLGIRALIFGTGLVLFGRGVLG